MKLISTRHRGALKGLEYWTYETPMPKIPPTFLDSVFYLYKSASDAKEGKRNGGTGFFVAVGRGDSPPFLYAVSNWHIVGPGPGLENATVARVNTKGGGSEALDGLTWLHHGDGDDLAIARVGLAPDYFAYSAIPSSLFLVSIPGPFEALNEEDKRATTPFGPGNEVFFIGRYADHEGKEKNYPVVRFGNVAMEPREPIRSELGIDQDSFIVESRSTGGFSGSPVFVNPSALIHEDGVSDFYMKMKTYLLGIVWGHGDLFQRVLGPDQETTAPGDPMWVKQNSGLMYVVPSWKLRDQLMSDEETALRTEKQDKWDEENKRKSRGVSLDAIEDKPTTSKLRRDEFDEALRKVTRKVDPPK